MDEKDGRIKIINEVLNGIKVISYLKIQTTIYPLSIIYVYFKAFAIITHPETFCGLTGFKALCLGRIFPGKD